MILGFLRFKYIIFSAAFLVGLLSDQLPLKAASSLAAWELGSNGVLKLRTSADTELQAFFQEGGEGTGDRVWIDFPGELSRPRTLRGSGPVNQIRLGKPRDGFTRFVIEFNKIISINPKELKLIGISPDGWELSFSQIPIEGLRTVGEGNLIRALKSPIYSQSSTSKYGNIKLSDLPMLPEDLYKVVIDPGHGGPDSGAVGIRGIRETDVVLDISLRVADILKKKGVDVYLTRKKEIDLDLYPRVSFANKLRADAFVSIHANATRKNVRRDVNGIETFFFSGTRGFRLASSIQEEVVNVSPGSPNRGVRRSRFFVIRRTNMPAALVETGFLTGRLDSSRLRQASYRRKLALAISKGVLLYLQEEGAR